MIHEAFQVKGVRGLAEDVAKQGRHVKLFDAVQDRLGHISLVTLRLFFVDIAPVRKDEGIGHVIEHAMPVGVIREHTGDREKGRVRVFKQRGDGIAEYALHAGCAPVVGIDFFEGGDEGGDDVGAGVAVLYTMEATEDVEGYGVLNVGQVDNNRICDTVFRNVVDHAVKQFAVWFDEAEATALLGVLLHTVFEQRAFAGAGLAEDVDAEVAVGFGERHRIAGAFSGVCLGAEVEHSGEGDYRVIVAPRGVIDRRCCGGRLSKQPKGKSQALERKISMELKDANMKDLVDAIEYQLKNIAKAEDIIEEKHQIQLPATARFNEQIRRLRDILDEHIKIL